MSIILMFIMSLCSANLFAQNQQIGLPEIRNYNRLNYKADPQNWDINQDKNGNIYFANNKGLIQFDGSTWRKYSLPNGGLIRSFKIDGSGNIFVGGINEFGYFKPKANGRMDYFSLAKYLPNNIYKQTDIVWKIHLHEGAIFFQSFANVYIFRNHTLKIVNAPSRFQFSYQVNNRLYFQDHKMGLLEYRNDKMVVLPATNVFNNGEIWGIIPFPNTNKLLISTLNDGLYIYDFKKVSAWNTEVNGFIKKYGSLGGVFLKNKFIINTPTNGIIKCDTTGKIIQHINLKNGLQNNVVLNSFVDSKCNLWLGLGNGIAFLNENAAFTHLGGYYNLSSVYASTIFKEHIYAATDEGLFYHSLKGNIKDSPFQLVEGTSGQNWNVQVIDNQLFCGSSKGAFLINDGRIVQTIDTKGYLGFKKIPNRPNTLIGSIYSGFSILEKTGNRWVFKHKIKGVYVYPFSFEVDNKYLWYKKDDSIYQMEFSEDLKTFKSVKNFYQLSAKDKGIGSVQLLRDTVYFQTNNHFYYYSPVKNTFVEDTKYTHLFKSIPSVNAIKQDSLGNIWYVFKQSLGVLLKSKGDSYKNVIAPFSNLTNNLVTNHFSINISNKNNVFVGLTDGLAFFDMKQMNNYDSKPIAMIRSFSYPELSYILRNGQKELAVYNIPYKSNQVVFTFSSPTYNNLENVEFSYKLEGFDAQWSNWSNAYTKEYTNLREGTYKMTVKVRNSYGIQSKEKTFTFKVAPPWYRHAVAYFAYIMLSLMTIYIIRIRIEAKIRRNKYFELIEQRKIYLEKEAKIRQEQFELEQEIVRLNNEKLKAKILFKDKELVNNSLQVVKKNKILNDIITKLKNIEIDTVEESVKMQFIKLNKSIVKEVNSDKSWKNLENHIKNVHYDFLKRLKEKYPTISPRELDLSTYLLINMSTKEIAELMNITPEGVELARYRLRKKLGLHRKDNLISFLMDI
ncbi:triple tyrosine motif-containing protein [Arcicella sp. LKC2W]|uniref:triple tyrosine motif-containing protein n=1 Tax=Arcicella sp. LKC2W TaxID=2984198 RepID=UPI002B2083A9|nr:triple tyrosine motif-containing protein [Arcicella sp. LKC2W]MEA5461471.1 triple tyrosine motif-containing protein [Arcicella sp. LKC2W]